MRDVKIIEIIFAILYSTFRLCSHSIFRGLNTEPEIITLYVVYSVHKTICVVCKLFFF